MQIRFADTRPTGAFALVLPVAGSDRSALAGLGDGRQAVEAAARGQRFDGESSAVAEAWIDDNGTARRLVLIGIGASADPEAAAEKLGGAIVTRLQLSGEARAVLDLSGLSFGAEAAAKVALAAALRNWRYDKYRTKLKDKQRPTLTELVIVGADAAAEERWTARFQPLLDGVSLTRELVTEPGNIIYPESFVARCQQAVAGSGLELEVLDEKQMGELGMGALLGVSLGSRREARLLVLKWNGGKAGTSPIVLVGKGVTFDTGGISIKPAAGMESMKWDMGGAGAIAGAMLTLARRKANANVVGICGLVENMPDGNAQRPGDVVTSMSGQTIEVINTDAEGRLVLCDALTYAQKTYRPKTIVDLATLTGAIMIALGHEYGGLYSNDDGLAAELTAAGAATGDKLWRMPLAEAYDRLIDSPIADIKNVGPREGGSITAAQFLARFIDEGVRWAHLDVAGMVWSDKGGTTFAKGATGYGVRVLDAFIEGNEG
jgi:leucyl aminopeptidase